MTYMRVEFVVILVFTLALAMYSALKLKLGPNSQKDNPAGIIVKSNQIKPAVSTCK